MLTRGSTPAVLLAALLVSGCVSGGGTSSSLGPAPNVPSGPAAEGPAIEGVVTTDELAPIDGAFVAIDTLPPATTGADGRFRIVGLEPGTHKLFAQALGYTSIARQVEVIDGQPNFVTLQLEKLPVQVPYTELLFQRGFLACDVSIFVFITYFTPCPFGARVGTIKANFSADWKYGVFELSWRALESLAFYTSWDGNCLTGSPCYGAVMGRSPQRIEAAPNDTALSAKYQAFSTPGRPYPEGKTQIWSNALYGGAFQQEIDSVGHAQCVAAIGFRFGCPGVGATTGITFDMYVSIFHYERPSDPGSYSGMPDK